MKKRSEISQCDKWDVESLYPSPSLWQEEYNRIARDATPKFPLLVSFKGHLHEGVAPFKEALECFLDLERTLEKLYTYAHLRHDEEITDDKNKSAYMRIVALLSDFREESAWFEPEILALPQRVIKLYLSARELASYQFYLQKIVRLSKHTLSADQEALLALAGKALQVSPRAFSSLNNADLKFKNVKDSAGISHELTHGLYQLYMRSSDRVLRENAFKEMHGSYKKMENTLAELINGQMQSHLFQTRARHFKSCLERALYPSDIPEGVYTSLINTVRGGLGSLHRYVALRKKVLKLPQIHLFDMSVPLVPEVDIQMDYERAEKEVIESVAPLGEEYQSLLREGLVKGRWVDKYENENKRSGAYSSGCYDSAPYILMNYRGILRDVFTLAHEAGHSMHSHLSKKNQQYHDSQYTIFVAEVASTFNEELLMHALLKKTLKPEEKIYLINEKIEDIRATLFRQAMFAEFELKLHELVERGTPLTPQLLKENYYQLVSDYFGSEAVIDSEIEIEWARIPHFYYNFYVYQYATGISAALDLAEKVLSGDQVTRERYLNFLKSGGRDFPINLLKEAGVDMTTSSPVESALRKFDALVASLELALKDR